MTGYSMPEHAKPFTPGPLHPLQAHLDNVLLTRAQPWPVTIGERTGTLRAVHTPFPFDTVGVLRLRCGARDWRVDLGNTEFLRFHPAVAHLSRDTDLPDPVRLAILDLLLAPLLPALQCLLGETITMIEMTPAPEKTPGPEPVAVLHLHFAFGDQDGASVPVRVGVPDKECALALAERIATLPLRSVSSDFQSNELPIAVAIEAGDMRLRLEELSGLKENDILLPQRYLAAQGQISIRPCPTHDSTSRSKAILCAVHDTQATVLAIVAAPEETPMNPSDASTTTSPQTEASAPAADESLVVDDIEINLCFELERRTLTVKDLTTLVPGYTFPLGCDPLAPVALRVNGTLVGTGRLVDMNGVLGVQITALTKNGGRNAGR